MHKLIISTVAVASVLAALSAAHAGFGIVQQPAIYSPPNQSRGEVNDQIAESIQAGYREGFQVVTDKRGQMLDNGRPATFKVPLQAGVQYRFAGRCDSDCTDLDMVLEDGSGRVLIADRDPDYTPGFYYRPSRSGEYTIRLELAACSAGRSQVGAVVMARR